MSQLISLAEEFPPCLSIIFPCPIDEGGKWDPDAAAYRTELTNE